MGTKVTSSSGSVLEEPEIQKLQMQAKIFKENSLNKLNALKSTTQLLERQTFSGCPLYQQAFAQLFGDGVRTFKFQLSQHMNNLETLLNAETLHEMDSKSALSVIKVQFEKGLNSDLLKPLDIYSRSFSSYRELVRVNSASSKGPSSLQKQRMKTSSGIVSDEEIDKQELEAHSVSWQRFQDNKQNEFEKYKAFNDQTIDYEIPQTNSNSRTLNVNAVCAEYGKHMFNSNHDACVSRYLNDVNTRTKKPNVVPISASKPKRKMNKSVATPHKKTVASDTTIQKSKSYYKELYENTNQEWKWKDDVSTSISPTIDIVSRITNVLKISNSLGSNLSNVPSSSNSLADCTTHPIHCLNHNLFSVGQFCDADLEVAFRKSTCFVRDLQGNDLLTGSRGSDLYTISLQETTSSTPICFMAKASPTQAWLWHRRLSHLNFDYITLLSKKDIVTGLPKLK
ncbi:retrovirus-related pol polyprotein from transposon TNT 1-94 [Tanacetum coccineum]